MLIATSRAPERASTVSRVRVRTAGLTVVPSVRRGGSEGIPGGLALLSGACGGGVGEHGVSGVVPAGADELEEVDDERCRLLALVLVLPLRAALAVWESRGATADIRRIDVLQTRLCVPGPPHRNRSSGTCSDTALAEAVALEQSIQSVDVLAPHGRPKLRPLEQCSRSQGLTVAVALAIGPVTGTY